MKLLYHWLFQTTWLAFWVYWIISAIGVKRTVKKEPRWIRLGYVVSMCLLFYLLAADDFHSQWLGAQVIPRTMFSFFSSAGLLFLGLGFAVWARGHLGRNWSGTVTLKEDHQLIRSGPYALVRHPIYTGILIAFLATALVIGQARGFVALAIMIVIHHYKSRREEKFMVAAFGEQYVRYRQEVPALVPFAPP